MIHTILRAILAISACEDAPISPLGAAPRGEFTKVGSSTPDCECEFGERVFVREYSVSYPGGVETCTVWDVCEALAVCGNLPPDVSTAGLFGVFKKREVCTYVGSPPPFN